MDLWDSIVRVTWDPAGTALVLVDFGAPMWEPVTLNGEQLVQSSTAVRAAGAKHFARGNETNQLTFSLARITDGVADALEARLLNAIALPRTKGDVLLTFESGTKLLLKDCAIRTWGGAQEEHLTRETLAILCGAMAETTATFSPGATWGE